MLGSAQVRSRKPRSTTTRGEERLSAVRSKPTPPYHRALADYVLKLLAPKRESTNAEIGFGELNISAHENLAVSRCLEATYLDGPSQRGCAEFYGPDGRLIWEQTVDVND